MRIYLFTSITQPNVSAFTSDSTGENLPAAYAPWQPSGNGSAIPLGDSIDVVLGTVQRDGFCLMDGSLHPSPGRRRY
jgi:hypothetical protein